ncbi:TPA: hypothetical protein HA278_00845 [Candidatus Woesearchaeota archaeon]|nr:hypothetical protein [archaeon]HIJ10578.1 hypothetical protein [Candidatus Woesearchaeota archaeon]
MKGVYLFKQQGHGLDAEYVLHSGCSRGYARLALVREIAQLYEDDVWIHTANLPLDKITTDASRYRELRDSELELLDLLAETYLLSPLLAARK